MLILHETYDHWSVAVLTVTVHSSFSPTFDSFLKICCFLHWIQSVNPHFYVTLYYNGSPYIKHINIILFFFFLIKPNYQMIKYQGDAADEEIREDALHVVVVVVAAVAVAVVWALA